jgi:acetyltransferase-like isoleucine patch superfamily enzyme
MINPISRTIHKTYVGITSRIRNLYYRSLGVKMDSYIWMRAIEIPRNWTDITLEEGVALDRGVTLLCSGPLHADKLIIRAGTYINRNTMFDAHSHLEVGRDCMIGPFCYLTDANHGTIKGTPVKAQPMQPSPVVIEDEVWIGAHVIVLAGVRIGHGAVIGAGSVVTSEVPPNTVVAGMPARVLRSRTQAGRESTI